MSYFIIIFWPDCIPSISIHSSTSSGHGQGYDDPNQLLLEACDEVNSSGDANYFVAPQHTYDSQIVLDLNCVVLISKIWIKNTRNGNSDE